MRMRYFGYHFENKKDKRNERQPISGILDAYCDYPCSHFKNSFKHNEETIFILKERERHYVFVKTKDTDLVKAINKSDIKIDEITARLKKNESVGFASHIYVTDDFIGFASTHLAPTISAFTSLISELFYRLGIKSHRLVVSPLTVQITRKQAQSMQFIGTTNIRVNRSSTMFSHLGGALGMDNKQLDDLQSFEITIKPLAKANIRDQAKTLIDLPSEGIERFQIRAKAELHDRLTDYRIENSLVLHDMVTQKDNEDIFTAIDRLVSENTSIADKVADHDAANRVKTMDISDIVKYHSLDSWPSPRTDTKAAD